MNDADDQRIQDLTRQALQQDIEQLDDATVMQLRAARLSALTALRSKRRLESMAGWAVAASVLLAFNVWWWQGPAGENVSAEDFEMIVSGEFIELYDDMDFYNWLGGEADAS